ncbi:MAG: GNAT family N-acetyltransferase [Alphaproteobacteria bacterium]|nr:GNAT family N-acetyltransferase [Alphaproteobacteria bacterium]
MIIPTLDTARLTLRAYREDDAPAIAALHGDREVVRFISPDGEPEGSLADAWDHIAKHTGHWLLKACGKWAVVEKTTHRFVGRVGYLNPPYEWPGLELGWTFCRDVWGMGYATEAAHVALNWGFENLPTDEIISAIHPDNAASIRVAKRIGERHLREGTVSGKPCLIYGMSRNEWRGSVSART